MTGLLPALKPIAIKERLSILFIEKCQLDVLDGAFVVVDKSGEPPFGRHPLDTLSCSPRTWG